MLIHSNSKEAFEQALQFIPGGVNSPVRSFKSVGGNPIFIESAKGAYVKDIDGNSYIDYVGSWGPMILGHAHDSVTEALAKALEKGTSYGAPTILETKMAELICSVIPSIESVRMVNSGTEATMSAIRLARGYTKRNKIIKFEGCYHGHGDSFLIKAGSGALTFGTPNSPGITPSTAADTLTAQFNDIDSVQALFRKCGDEIAAIILEPVTGNMGVVIPNQKFLQQLRELCDAYGALLIFDEVMTGFRLGIAGSQSLYPVKPDITTLGKIIGGGLPVGAYGGSKKIMDMLAPKGPVYQAGTLSGNPLAMTAGYVTLQEILKDPNFYSTLNTKAERLEIGIKENLQKLNIPAVFNRLGSMFTLFFTKQEQVNSFTDACTSNTEAYAQFFLESLHSGIYLAPSQYEAGFVSMAHTNQDIDNTILANYKALEKIKPLL